MLFGYVRRKTARLVGAHAIRWVVAGVMVVQLAAIDNHDHNPTTFSDHCAACHLSVLFAGNAPAFAPPIPVAAETVIDRVEPQEYLSYVQAPRFLIPPAQAPPAAPRLA